MRWYSCKPVWVKRKGPGLLQKCVPIAGTVWGGLEEGEGEAEGEAEGGRGVVVGLCPSGMQPDRISRVAAVSTHEIPSGLGMAFSPQQVQILIPILKHHKGFLGCMSRVSDLIISS
jgi:hypothetical protein